MTPKNVNNELKIFLWGAKRMIKSEINHRRVRKNFGRIETVAEMPNLIDVQINSYKQFLQMGVPPEKRTESGLQAVFKSVFPSMILQDVGIWNS